MKVHINKALYAWNVTWSAVSEGKGVVVEAEPNDSAISATVLTNGAAAMGTPQTLSGSLNDIDNYYAYIEDNQVSYFWIMPMSNGLDQQFELQRYENTSWVTVDTGSVSGQKIVERKYGVLPSGHYNIRVSSVGASTNDTYGLCLRSVPATIQDEDVVLSSATFAYTGEAVCPGVYVGVNNNTLIEGTDYEVSYADNVMPGQGSVTVRGIGSFSGSVTKTFTIEGSEWNYSNLKIESVPDQTYTGQPISPALDVRFNDIPLVEGRDYEVSYSGDHTNAGYVRATVTGIGGHSGSRTVTFNIVDANLAEAVLEPIPDQTYTGRTFDPDLVLTYNGVQLVEGEDYNRYDSYRRDVGQAEFKISGRGNFTGERTITFNIAPRQMSDLQISPISEQLLNHDPCEPTVTVEDPYYYTSSVLYTLDEDDYEVTYRDNSAVGTGHALVTGKGNYGGTVDIPFAIKRQQVNWNRLAGNSALDTMNEIIKAGDFKTGGTVILTTSNGYWDALTAAGLAGMADAPIVMTDESLSSGASNALFRLNPSKVIVCGGPVAVSEYTIRLAKIYANQATFVRIYGQNAIETANQIYKEAHSYTSGSWGRTAFVCTNDGYWDALSAAPISYAKNMPIFLTDGANAISTSTLQLMRGNVDSVYIVGGNLAITSEVENRIKAAGIKVNGRLKGQTAIETSEAVAEYGLSLGMSAEYPGVATVGGYWDALSGAALCGSKNSPLVLVDGADSSTISSFVARHKEEMTEGEIFGGTMAISPSVQNALEQASKRE